MRISVEEDINLYNAKHQFKIFGAPDLSFAKFEPSVTELHYRDPVHYAEMLHIVVKLEKEKLTKDLQRSQTTQVAKRAVGANGAVFWSPNTQFLAC